MSGRPHPLNFLNFRLGHVLEFPVEATTTGGGGSRKMARLKADGRPHREWVALKDGPKLIAIYKGQEVTLEFGKRSDLRRARRWLRDAQRPRLANLELTASAAGSLEGTLRLSQTALTAHLDHAPEILLSEALIDQIGDGDIKKCRNRLIKSGGISSPWPDEDCVLVIDVPVQLTRRERDDEREVKVILSNDNELVCRLEGSLGEQYLKAVRYVRRQGERVRLLTGVQFVSVPEMPKIRESEDKIAGTNLTAMEPVTNDELTAWSEYEFADRERRKALLKRRREVVLEYDEVVGKPKTDGKDEKKTYWKVRIRNGIDDCEKWLKQEGDKFMSASKKIEAAVDIYELAIGPGSGAKPAQAIVQSLCRSSGQDQIIARIVWNRSDSMPSQGKIVAREHYGDITQDERRDKGLTRLRTGQSVNPNLLRYLFFPQTIPEVEGKNKRMWHRPDGQPLNDSQKQAVIRAAKEPALLLIQGPPGTGKTTVIAEIIHQLRHRYRNRTAGEPGSGEGPLRVLVSSIQNEAVANAADKLGGDEVFVDRHVRGEDSDLASGLRGKTIAARLWEKMSQRPTFQRYRDLCDIRRALETLAAHLFSEPSQAVAYFDEFAQPENLRLLGGALQDDLDELRRGLGKLVADEESRGEASEDEEAVWRLPHDLESSLQRLLDCPEELILEDCGEMAKLIEDLGALIEEGGKEVREATIDLQSKLQRSQKAFDKAKKIEAVDKRLRTKWVGLREEIERLLSDDSDGAEDGERPLSPREEWLMQAQDWLKRGREDVNARLGEASTSEEAILFDWISWLNQRPAMMEDIVAEYAPVRAATCQSSAKFYDERRPYDVVIIDEAARGGLDVLIPMTMGRSIILIGDQNQLPPHVDKELERQLDEEIRREVDLTKTSLFSYLWEELGGPAAHENCVSLTKQYRMHRDIGEIVSRVFYEPKDLKLEHHCQGGPAAQRAPRFGLFDDEPFVWLDTRDVLCDQKKYARRYRRPWSLANPYEVDLILKILGELDDGALKHLASGRAEKPIGVISFYKNQEKALRRQIERQLPHLWKYIELGTADSFQGKDFPLVLLSTVRSNNSGKVGFLKLPNRLNVGISRAKNQVILIGDSQTLAHRSTRYGSEPFRRVWNLVQDAQAPGNVVDSLDFFD